MEEDTFSESFGSNVLQILTAVRRYKSENQLPLSADLELLQIIAKESWMRKYILESDTDLKSATRSKEIELVQEFSQGTTTLIMDASLGAALVETKQSES